MTKRELTRAGILFLLAAGAFFYPFLLGKTSFVGDVTYSFQPWLTYAAQEFQAGRFPLWNPFSACGEPFLANPQIMAFYPPAALFWLFPFSLAWRLFLVFNQAFLFLAAYFLARRWMTIRPHGPRHAPAALAALAFAWSGFVASYWEFPAAGATLPFLPLLFLFALTQAWLPLALATGLAFGSGYIQFVYYAVFLGAVGAWRAGKSVKGRARSLTFFCAATAVGAVLLAAQILPSWEAARESIRAAIGTEEARRHLLSPVFFVKLWVPWITNIAAFAFQQPPFGAEFWPIQRAWLNTLFLGTAPFLLACVGVVRGGWRNLKVLGTVVIISLVLSMGVEPLFGWVRAWAPGFRYMTHFANASILGLLAFSLWVAEGARLRRWRSLWLTLAGFAAAGSGAALAVLPAVRKEVLHRLLGLATLSSVQDRWVAQAGGAAAAAALFVLALWLLFGRRHWMALWLFTLGELWLVGRALQPVAPADFFHRPLALARRMAESPFRFSLSPAAMRGEKPMGGMDLVDGYEGLRQAFYPNVPLPFRVHQTWSYEVFGQRRFAEFRRRLPALPGASPAYDFLGAALVMTTAPLPPPARFLARRDNALLYRRSSALPRVTVVPRAVEREDSADRLNYLFGPWRPDQEVVLEKSVPAKKGDIRLADWSESPGRVTATGEGEGWLVYSGVWNAGWEAAINGKRDSLYRANHAFQAVATPPGPWTARLLYRPRLFRAGLWITALTALFLAAAGLIQAFRTLRKYSSYFPYF